MDIRLDEWDDDGGAGAPVRHLHGSAAQVEWAERIRLKVSSEFDRVAAAFQGVATKQSACKRRSTEAVIAILEEKRDEVMRSNSAGYFIRDWQDLNAQVRHMIFSDPRYKEIKQSGKNNR